MTENVFLNKIDIISRQQRLLQDEGEEEWHYSKRGERQQPYQPKHITEKQRPLRQHYNFLEDIKRNLLLIQSSKELKSLNVMNTVNFQGQNLNSTKRKWRTRRKNCHPKISRNKRKKNQIKALNRRRFCINRRKRLLLNSPRKLHKRQKKLKNLSKCKSRRKLR